MFLFIFFRKISKRTCLYLVNRISRTWSNHARTITSTNWVILFKTLPTSGIILKFARLKRGSVVKCSTFIDTILLMFKEFCLIKWLLFASEVLFFFMCWFTVLYFLRFSRVFQDLHDLIVLLWTLWILSFIYHNF